MAALIPIAALVVGWFLNEFGKRRSERRERTAAVGRAIAALLEIRERLVVERQIVALLARHLPLDAQSVLQMRALFEPMIVTSPDAHLRLDAALNELAGLSPAGAFSLRRFRDAQPLLSSLHKHVSPSEGQTANVLAEWLAPIEADLVATHLLPGLDESLIALATRHGRRTRREIRDAISHMDARPPALDEFERAITSLTQSLASSTKADSAAIEAKP